MKKFFYIGPNKELRSGFSIKFWKIERKGKTVTAYWGPAQLDHLKRRVLVASWTQSCSWIFNSTTQAKLDLERRIDSQLRHGYYRLRRRG
jgi:hypothetical protein